MWYILISFPPHKMFAHLFRIQQHSYLVRMCLQRVRLQEKWVPNPIWTAGTVWSLQGRPLGRERARFSGFEDEGRHGGKRGIVLGYLRLAVPLGCSCCCCWRIRQHRRRSPGLPQSQWEGHRSSQTDPGTEKEAHSEHLGNSSKHFIRAGVQQVAHFSIS